MAIDLIYCADGNRRFAEIAVNAGYKYGARLPPAGLPFAPYFADQDWKNPDRERYTAELEKHRPYMATVLDWERGDQLQEVLDWAEDAARYVEVVLVIPKVINGVARLPRRIGGKPVRLAYSVPTRYGGTEVPIWEFYGWPIHLLGGSPQEQMKLTRYLNVVSADGNYAMSMASRYNQFWRPGDARYAKNRWWPALREADGQRWGNGTSAAGAPYEAFRRSCKNILAFWRSEFNY